MRTPLAVVLLLAASCSTLRTIPRPAPEIDEGRTVPPTTQPVRGEPAVWLGAEVRGYPAGAIPALYGEAPVSEHGVITFDLGANLTDRQDFGEHDDEQGRGFGGGVGYRHYFGEQLDRWFVGGRMDLWSLSIDWREGATSGDTDVVVLQPTVEGGYGFWLGERSRLSLFAAAGAEINVDTYGESVGDGAIGILGVSWVHGF